MTRVLIIGALDAELGQAARIAAARGARVAQADGPAAAMARLRTEGADLVLCDLEAPLVVDPEKLRSRSRNTPFDGRRLQGVVRRTFVAGRTVFED
jgi:dihydroorotase-like cyclic amidohydrolase